MIGWTFVNMPAHIVVRCRECGGAATMEDPFIQVQGRDVKEALVGAPMRTRELVARQLLSVILTPSARRKHEACDSILWMALSALFLALNVSAGILTP